MLVLGIMLIPVTTPRASLDARQIAPAEIALQAVERPEENFAGSAFYFIDPGYAIPQNYADLAIDPLATARRSRHSEDLAEFGPRMRFS